MKHLLRLTSFLVLAALPSEATIHYTVSLEPAEQHLCRVTMTVPEVKDALVVRLPAWNGLYQIRDFSHHVREVRAYDADENELRVEKQDKHTWRISGGPGTPEGSPGRVTLRYAVYWDEPDAFSSQLNHQHAFLNLATVLFYVPERRSEDTHLEFTGVPEGWGIAVALEPGESSSAFRAPHYDALVDAPVEVSRFEEFRLEVAGARIRVVVHAREWDRAWLEDAVRRIVEYQTALMRDAPFKEFLILYHFGQGGSGMEHANSTAIWTGSSTGAAGVTAHEFFHLWNVKRIRPQGLEPVDYTRENWSRALWFAEGVTNTYAAYTLVRTGLWSRQQFFDDLAGQITTLEARPARRWKSAEEASLDAWHERYPLYRGPEFSISYYNKGQILGVLLDILIRDASGNRSSLDDVLRHLNDEFARKGRFYNESADLRTVAERFAGRSLEEFFSRNVSGTEELPCRELLARAGLELVAREAVRADFGFAALSGIGGTDTVVGGLGADSPAEKAGVRNGDLLVGLNDAPFPPDPAEWLRGRRAGEKVRVRVRRGDEEQEFSFALGERRERRYEIRESKNPTDKQRRIREGLLKGITEQEAPAVETGG